MRFKFIGSQTGGFDGKRAFADVAKQGDMVAAAHLSFPGIGHIRATGSGYTWIPINYSSTP